MKIKKKKKKLEQQGLPVDFEALRINTLEYVSEADGGGTCNFGYCYECGRLHPIGKECSRGEMIK